MPILGILASSTRVAAGDFESIATVTVGSGGAANVEFTSISGTYTHLQLRAIIYSGNLDIEMQFNGATGSTDYVGLHQLKGDGSSASAVAVGERNSFYWTLAPQSGNYFGAVITDILDYTNTNKYKTIRTLGGRDMNGSGDVFLRSGLYKKDTNAITSIKVFPSTSTFNQYSHFALYGIKSA